MKELGGYFITSAYARKVAEHLGIDPGEDTVFNNSHLEWSFNNWLYKNEKLHILAAYTSWPKTEPKAALRKEGMFFMTKHRNWWYGSPTGFTEDESDLGVKKWLEECGADDLQWGCFLDEYAITLNGVKPQYSDMKFVQLTPEESEVMQDRWFDEDADAQLMKLINARKK